MNGPAIKENHWQGNYDDRSILRVNHYNERGVNLKYFWQQILLQPTTTNEDMEAARQEACKVFIDMGGHVIITILDSLQIPENDRNAPIDMRPGHPPPIGKAFGWDVYAKKKTGDPGDQYYDWKQETDHNNRIYTVKRVLEAERRNGRHNGNGKGK